jgi:serine/threonine protein kinase
LRHELPPEKLARITGVQPQPFAAGSFGQVYYGQLDNGQPIIIKVLRPMIRELLKYDLKLLSAFSKSFFNKLYKNMSIRMQDALRDFSAATLRETDYRSEVAFANEMYQNYKDHPTLVIPQTYSDLCTDNIIVQDYVDGISCAQLIKLAEQGVDPAAYIKDTLGSDLQTQLETVGYESLMGIFRFKRIQGDPHPGNIRFMTNNRVGLIDFGISAESPYEKSALFGMLESYDHIYKGSQTAVALFEQGLRFFVSDLYRALKKLATIYGKQNKDYVTEVSRVASDVFAQATGSDMINFDVRNEQGILATINRILNKGNRFGLVMKLENSDILRSIQTFGSLLGRLHMSNQVMPVIMDRAVQDIQKEFPEVLAESDDHIAVSDAIDTITKWLERVAEKDPALFRQLMGKIKVSQMPKTQEVDTNA